MQWLRDELRLIRTAAKREYANEVQDTNGVYVIPAFTGLGAPYWDQYARGAIVGVTRGCNREHIIRATLESIAYQAYDVIKAMENDLGEQVSSLRVDGGASANNFLMQFQADILDTDVLRPECIETTAGRHTWQAWQWDLEGQGRNQQNWTLSRTFTPSMDEERRSKLLAGWHKAVGRSFSWADE